MLSFHTGVRILMLLAFSFRVHAQEFRTIRYPDNRLNEEQYARLQAVLPRIDSLYRQSMQDSRTPGLSYAIIANGRVIQSSSLGYTDLQKKIPVTSRSVFRIASMSKSFTALAILQLRDAGKLRLDDPVSKYLPELSASPKATSDAPDITIRHVLNHVAGFPEDNPWGDRRLADSEAQLRELLKKGVHFSNTPGFEYEYSNLGFALAGAVISKVSGESYQSYITKHLLKPLGMQQTYWEYQQVPASELAHGYRYYQGNWQEESLLHDGAWGAMGGMLCSVDDFVRYAQFHIQAWPPRDERENFPVKRSTLREMHQPQTFVMQDSRKRYGRSCLYTRFYSYGLRWERDCAGTWETGHSGGLPGFGSNWKVVPELGIGVICFANVTYAPAAAWNARVLDMMLDAIGPEQAPMAPSHHLQKTRDRLMKEILPNWKDAEKSPLFADNFFPDNPLDDLRQRSLDLFRQAGTIRQVSDVRALNHLRGSFQVLGDSAILEVFFTLTPEAIPRIQEFSIRKLN